MSDIYCGIKKMPKGKRLGSMAECAEKGQINYWGLNKADTRVIENAKNLKKNVSLDKARINKMKFEMRYKKAVRDYEQDPENKNNKKVLDTAKQAYDTATAIFKNAFQNEENKKSGITTTTKASAVDIAKEVKEKAKQAKAEAKAQEKEAKLKAKEEAKAEAKLIAKAKAEAKAKAKADTQAMMKATKKPATIKKPKGSTTTLKEFIEIQKDVFGRTKEEAKELWKTQNPKLKKKNNSLLSDEFLEMAQKLMPEKDLSEFKKPAPTKKPKKISAKEKDLITSNNIQKMINSDIAIDNKDKILKIKNKNLDFKTSLDESKQANKLIKKAKNKFLVKIK